MGFCVRSGNGEVAGEEGVMEHSVSAGSRGPLRMGVLGTLPPALSVTVPTDGGKGTWVD